MEYFNKNDWEEINGHLNELSRNLIEKYPKYRPYYQNIEGNFWIPIIKYSNKLGFEISFLENKDTWLKINKKIIQMARLESKIHEDILFKEENETDFDYAKKLFRCNEASLKKELRFRKIHEIDRDSDLLKSISKEYLDIAIVGLGHSDFWYENRFKIKQTQGITFDSYSTDLIIPSGYKRYFTKFTKNAVPNQIISRERKNLELCLNLIEHGKFTEKNPDYVGIWDSPEPSRGYFEVFLNNSNNLESDNFSGTIIDSYGKANFKGNLSDNHLSFLKKYETPFGDAIKTDIKYRAIKVDDEFYGRYDSENGGNIFYMIKSSKEKPINLAINLERKYDENPNFFEQFTFN